MTFVILFCLVPVLQPDSISADFPQYGLSFKHPSSWHVSKNQSKMMGWPGNPTQFFDAINQKSDTDYLGEGQFVITFKAFDKLIDIRDCPALLEFITPSTVDSVVREWNQYRDRPVSASSFLFDTKELLLSARPALRFFSARPAHIEGAAITSVSYYFHHKKMLFECSIATPTGSMTNQIISDFDQFVQAIRFWE